MNALETMALTEKQQKIQICENQPGMNNRGNWSGEMGEMRVEVGVKESSKKKLVRSTWAGHVEKTGRWKTSRCPESGGEMEARKTEIATGIALKVT